MTQNITITVPDELGAKVENWRDTMKVSKVCQKALKTEIARLEDFPKFGKELEDALERLRTQKETSYRVGLEVGVEYAKNEATLGELRELDHGWPSELADLPSRCQQRFRKLASRYHVIGTTLVMGKYADLPLNEEEFTRGCRDGIDSVWKVLRDKV